MSWPTPAHGWSLSCFILHTGMTFLTMGMLGGGIKNISWLCLCSYWGDYNLIGPQVVPVNGAVKEKNNGLGFLHLPYHYFFIFTASVFSSTHIRLRWQLCISGNFCGHRMQHLLENSICNSILSTWTEPSLLASKACLLPSSPLPTFCSQRTAAWSVLFKEGFSEICHTELFNEPIQCELCVGVGIPLCFITSDVTVQ